MTERFSNAFFLIANQMMQKYGEPAPKQICTIGDEYGWLIKLNPTNEDLDGVMAYHANVYHVGLLVGIINPYTGTMMADSEDALIEWLETKEPAEAGE